MHKWKEISTRNKNLQKATNDFIEEKFYAQDLENMDKYDQKEKEENDLLKRKKDEQMRNNKRANAKS